MSTALQAAEAKLRADGAGEAIVTAFARFHALLESGVAGMIPESTILPAQEIPDAEELDGPDGFASGPLEVTVVIKLNGGLGTGMGMTRAKSLIEAREGLTFLDVIARQVIGLRERTGARPPLIAMNSFAPRDDTLAALATHPGIESDLPLDFLQNRVPKLRADDLHPVDWPAYPGHEWAPPGHGDLYTALVTSGLLERMLAAGYRYAFVSNADNLGATLDPAILGWFAAEGIPFLMEVADRTAADRKGGHLARRPDGGLILREIAQVPDSDLDSFQDTGRHRFFNTNTLWLDLQALAARIDDGGGVLDLPLIVNRKTVDPGDSDSTAVIQLESAMGAAIGLFEGAQAIRVPRTRFAPVKTTSDLLALRSDAYRLTAEGQVALVESRNGEPPLIELDPSFYKLLDDFERRFPGGPPSLVECERLTVNGDLTFGSGVVVRGEARAEGDEVPGVIPDGAILEG
ncbi:MAG: UTP--glucose-1-phosphate uridylyltransferase [Actinomycetes bacterium]